MVPLERLRAERARGMSFDVGRLWTLDHGSIETNATAFGSEINNALNVIPVNGVPEQFRFANAQAPTRTVGTELLARWRVGPIAATVTHACIP